MAAIHGNGEPTTNIYQDKEDGELAPTPENSSEDASILFALQATIITRNLPIFFCR